MAYRLNFGQEVSDSVRNCAREELGLAGTLLDAGFDGDPVEAVHEARKSIKKTRALLRLVRPGLPKPIYRRENGALRDAARLISGTRDADVMVETMEKLAERFGARMGEGSTALCSQLRTEAHALRTGPPSGGGRAQAGAALDVVARRIEDLPLERCDWATVAAGIERAYRDGRQAYARADAEPTAERLHDWRKRVKDIWYHQRLVCPAWPEVLGVQAEAAHQLSEILGDDHDLAVLALRLETDHPAWPGAAEGHAGPLPELIAERRAELLAQASGLGSLVYAEGPRAFARRIERYLDHAQAQSALPHGPRV